MKKRVLKVLSILAVVLCLVLVGCRQSEPVPPAEGTPGSSPAAEPTPADGVLIVMTVSAQEVKVGDTVEVDVEVLRVENLTGAEIHLQFASGLVEFEDADPDEQGLQVSHGEFVHPDFVAINQVDHAQGQLSYAIAQMPPSQPVSGNGVLFTASFTALQPGDVELVITSAILADDKGVEIPAVLINEVVTITIK
ncbi:MAG: cohesin domain-containing protein [Anaerolineae bacterium]|nr:cohesin domain-containing protein [Anaerolineae bacterium]